MARKQIKMLIITGHQGNTDQNHSVMPAHTPRTSVTKQVDDDRSGGMCTSRGTHSQLGGMHDDAASLENNWAVS